MHKSDRKTQHDKIISAFREHGGILTPSDIMRLGIAQYNTRIFELKRGVPNEKGETVSYNIKNEYLGTFDGIKHTRFVLVGKWEKGQLTLV